MKKINFVKFVKKHILPTHLLARFVLIILLPTIALQMVVAIFFYNRHWDTISRQLANNITGEIEGVVEWVKSNPPKMDEHFVQLSISQTLPIVYQFAQTLFSGIYSLLQHGS